MQSVGKILSQLPIKRLGVFATKATINSGAYEKEVNKYNKDIKVFGQYCPSWVRIVENDLTKDLESIAVIEKDLQKMLTNNPEKIVLGCTHYPYLLNILSVFAPKDIFIDPANHFAQYIKDDLTENNLLNDSSNHFEEFYVSSAPEKFKQAAKMFYNLKQNPKLLTF